LDAVETQRLGDDSGGRGFAAVWRKQFVTHAMAPAHAAVWRKQFVTHAMAPAHEGIYTQKRKKLNYDT
jgi:hypothetical protein